MIVIDIIEGCNFKCYFCNAYLVGKVKYMPLELFKSIIDQAAKLGITHIDMIPSKGEPFLHPNIYEMIEYANDRMKFVIIFSNATLIDAEKYQSIRHENIKLNISYYGATPERFKELTLMDKNLFDKVHNNLENMKAHGIKFQIERRDVDYEFSFGESDRKVSFDNKVKCQTHFLPTINVNGDVTYCKFIKSNIRSYEGIYFANLNQVTLEEALSNPLRYKFYHEQNICEKYCTSFTVKCYVENLASIKLMMKSKNKYEANQSQVDLDYADQTERIINHVKTESSKGNK